MRNATAYRTYLPPSASRDIQIIIYQTVDGQTAIDVKLENETVWLGQIYKTNELEEASTCAKFAQVQTEGSRTISREISHSNR